MARPRLGTLMLPRYTLPATSAARNINLDTKPKQVAAWLTRLPLSNPVEAAGELADYMEALNGSVIDHEQRVKVAELLSPVVEETVSSLREQCNSVSLPLPPRLKRHPEFAQRLLLELTNTYKILILEWLGRTFRFNKKILPAYLQRVLLFLQAVLEISYETHQNIPRGVWVDLHQTFNYALKSGLSQSVSEGSSKMQSLEQVYKSTLLMALADPYQFPHIEIPWAKDIIARYNNLASLIPAEEAKGQTGIFHIDVNADSSPKPQAWGQHPTTSRWDLMLNTTELVKHLAMLATHVKGREDPEKLGLPAAARDPEYAVMLRRLKLNWGASQQRQSQRRRHRPGQEYDVSFGLRALHQIISAETGASHEPIQHEQSGDAAPPTLIRCMVVDDSMGGLALRRDSNLTTQVKVGDLVGIRQEGASWTVGLVKWFRVPKPGDLYFGIQLLAPKAIAVQIRRTENAREVAGLLVQASTTLKQSPMLLAPPGSLAPDQRLELQSATGNISVRTEKRMEYTPSIEVYRITIA